jgi:dipeptidyl aminopeptidase/acylaminoacyl peptidase
VLERKLNGPLPPLMLIQGTNDDNLPPDTATRFAAAWRNAGGMVRLHEFAGMPHAFITRQLDAAASKEALVFMAAFIKEQAKNVIARSA